MTLRFVFTIVLELLVFAVYASGSELNEIMLTASQMPKRLSSYQFTVIFEGDALHKEDKAAPQIIKFTQSGGQFIVDSQMKDGSNSPANNKSMIQHIIYAFNGSKYQWYIVGRDTVSFSQTCQHPNLYFFPNPVMLPYYWLITQQTNWSDIKNEEIWNKRFAKAKIDGQTTINGKICDVVGLPDPLGKYDSVYAYFAKDLDSYPLRVKLIEKQSITLIDVSQYSVKQTEMGKIIFPLKITLTIIDKGQEQIQLNWRLLSESLQVNPTLDDDLFTISPSNIGTVIDYDEVLKNVGSETVRDPIVMPQNGWGRWGTVIIINLLFIALIIAILVFKKRK